MKFSIAFQRGRRKGGQNTFWYFFFFCLFLLIRCVNPEPFKHAVVESICKYILFIYFFIFIFLHHSHVFFLEPSLELREEISKFFMYEIQIKNKE